jgi:hypothetical protein
MCLGYALVTRHTDGAVTQTACSPTSHRSALERELPWRCSALPVHSQSRCTLPHAGSLRKMPGNSFLSIDSFWNEYMAWYPGPKCYNKPRII